MSAVMEPTVLDGIFDYAPWRKYAACAGKADLFFGPPGERPTTRKAREGRASEVCGGCLALGPCRSYARANREYGYWGGESEEDRQRLGCGPPIFQWRDR